MRKNILLRILSVVFALVIILSAVSCDLGKEEQTLIQSVNPTETPTKAPTESPTEEEEPYVFDLSHVPAYDGKNAVYILNGNIPVFDENEITTQSFENYEELDSLGRCTLTIACIGKDLMPTDKRGSVSSVTPTGWHSGQIYERSHLIGWQLTGENANKQNLITGTFTLNGEMQTFEDMVASFIKETNYHVMYRVTPVFEGNNLLASGVHMEGYSVEDSGESICFNVYIYNVQNDYIIDYATGDSKLSDDSPIKDAMYVINKNNGKFHKPDCYNVAAIDESNREYTNKTREELIKEGRISAGCCHP